MLVFGLRNIRYVHFSVRNLSNTNDNCKSFKDIPGPLSLPIVGTLYLYLPFVGRYQFDRLHRNARKNYEKYGPIVKEQIVPGQFIVWLGDPDDIAKMFQTEGVYPRRRSHLALEKFRLDRPHIYNSGGLLPTNGSDWARIRKVFQKGLSSPGEALTFIKDSDQVIVDWIQTRFLQIHTQTQLDHLPELSRLFLELIGIAAFDIRFQCFDGEEMDPKSRTSQLLEAAFVSNSTILKTDNSLHLWKKIETPSYRKLRKAQELMQNVAIDLVSMKLTTFRDKSDKPPTLLEKYISSTQLDFKDLVGGACDFLLAGMDTTTYATSFLLYHLAKNEGVQEKLYEEAKRLLPDHTQIVTADIYKEAEYAKCVVKESLRLNPISIGVGRVLTSDVVFSGYKVPSGTVVVTLNQILCRLEKYFPDPETFRPERWMRDDPFYVRPHPYLVIPFGHGQRACIARRLAELNMTLLILRLFRRYKASWAGSTLDSRSLLINKPDAPILLKWEQRV